MNSSTTALTNSKPMKTASHFMAHAGIQKYLEDNGYEIISSEFVRIPNDVKDVTPEQRETIEKLLEKFEDDDDVQNVFHNMREDDTDEAE